MNEPNIQCAVCQHPLEDHRAEDNACPSIDGLGYSSAYFRPERGEQGQNPLGRCTCPDSYSFGHEPGCPCLPSGEPLKCLPEGALPTDQETELKANKHIIDHLRIVVDRLREERDLILRDRDSLLLRVNSPQPETLAALEENERLRVYKARLDWLHSTGPLDEDGYEWGVFRVKWENGGAVSVMHTLSDMSDLDAQMRSGIQKESAE
jgi:hypothetical protein